MSFNYMHKLPSEIRRAIFDEILQVGEEINNKTPSLIIALRPDRILYEEALAVLYAKGTFWLTQNNAGAPLGNSISRVKCLGVHFFSGIGDEPVSHKILLASTHIQEVKIFIPFWDSDKLKDVIDFMKNVISRLCKNSDALQKVEVDFGGGDDGGPIVSELNSHLRSKGREETIKYQYKMEDLDGGNQQDVLIEDRVVVWQDSAQLKWK